MASEELTISSLTSEPDDLTDLLQQTPLQIAHVSRHTKSGFLVKEDRLPGCVPSPIGQTPLHSWIWHHGHAISCRNDARQWTRYWLCQYCYDKMVLHPTERATTKSAFMIPAAPTSRPAIHLQSKHNLDATGPLATPSKKRKHGTIKEAITKQQKLNNTTFDRAGWIAAYVEWVVCSGVSLRQAVQPEHYRLLVFHNSRIDELVPNGCHATPRLWIMKAYHSARTKVIESISKATSRLTISFDGWKANNDLLDLLGVVAHYLDHNHNLKTVVLGLRDTMGSHTGANIADYLSDVLQDFEIAGSQVAYYAADNATNNDTALKELNAFVKVNHVTQRLRCAGHIYNLVCNAILYGTDEEALEDASQASQHREIDAQEITDLDTTLRNSSEEAQLRAWRKRGPVGKLHNLMVTIKGSRKQREIFERKQRKAIDEAGDEPVVTKIYRVILNGGIRWNSTYLMIRRGILLKDAIAAYQLDDDAVFNTKDSLDKDDWLVLVELRDLLAPIYEASLHVQSTPSHDQTHGALHEVLTSMDFVLTHLERAKDSETYTRAIHYKTAVNLGWMKLDQYYSKTDANPAYILAVFLHPHYRQHWFEARWDKVDYDEAELTVNRVYAEAKKHYNTLVPRRTSPIAARKELSGLAAHNNVSKGRSAYTDDDLQRYRREQQAPHDVNPLTWWRDNQHNYPILKHLAFDVLAAPASTAADERLFSMAGNVVNEQRPHTQEELAQAVQCLRSWYQGGLI